MSRTPIRPLPLLLVLALLLVAYIPTLQTIINGSAHYYALDVGETQIVLNVGGTLHATGYPLYALTGTLLTGLFGGLGVNPALAPALVSLLWGLIALALTYGLFAHISGRAWLSAAAIGLLGLTRTIWIHHAIAEIYTFGLMLLVGLLLLALWRGEIRGRILWLALLGGIGVGHHRAIAFAAPALIFAAWPAIWPPESDQRWSKLLRLATLGTPLALLGVFGPYLYLWWRAQVGAPWVYGDPSTLAGLWAQFTGAEAERYIGLPETWEALQANWAMVNTVLLTDLTLPGLIAGVVGLGLALRTGQLRRTAITMLLSAGAAYLFHVLVYQDVLSALILPVLLAVAFGWLVVLAAIADWVQQRAQHTAPLRRMWIAIPVVLVVVLAVALVVRHGPFIHELVTDEAGLEAIALAEDAPPGSTLMLAWGGQYFAVKYAQDVDPTLAPELDAITVVDHRTNLYAPAQAGTLVTPAYTLYNQPPAWWVQYLGQPPVIEAAAPGLVRIGLTAPDVDDPPETFGPVDTVVTCAADRVILNVTWYTPDVPAEDLSVFVHARDADDALLGQGDQSAPVFGWRSLTGWAAGEAVRDVYAVAVNPAAVTHLRYGFYRAVEGGFENVYEYTIPVECGG